MMSSAGERGLREKVTPFFFFPLILSFLGFTFGCEFCSGVDSESGREGRKQSEGKHATVEAFCHGAEAQEQNQ